MKNAIVKRFAKFGLLAVIMIIAVSASAKAQSLDYGLTANIPFDFSVGGKKLPAGKYRIGRAQVSNGDQIIQIRSTDGHSNISRLTIPVIKLNSADNGSLVFHRYGDEYFLSEIWPASGLTGRELPKSRTERDLVRKVQDRGIAAMQTPQMQTITIRVTTN